MRDVWMRLGAVAAMVLWVGWTTGCAPAESEGEAEAAEAPAAEEAAATSGTAAAPDTTGAGLWAHMQEEDYRNGWSLWPGLAPFYTGNEPHGMLLTTYANAVAHDALMAGEAVLPEGSVVIKENYMPNRELAAITVMYKRSGYNPDHNDWFFAKFLPDGSLDAAPNGMALEGRLPGCQQCHIQRAEQDYLYSPRPGEGDG